MACACCCCLLAAPADKYVNEPLLLLTFSAWWNVKPGVTATGMSWLRSRGTLSHTPRLPCCNHTCVHTERKTE